MIKESLKPEIKGTRAGYVIRFSCPACAAENIIVTRTARDHLQETRTGSCNQCGSRSTIRTPSVVSHDRNRSFLYPFVG